MARAIVRRPKAFLFDEPLSNLDAKLRLEVRAEIASLRRRTGTTTVYVTHDQVEAMTLADRIVVLDAGVAQQIGPPLELYRKPANPFVATFLGTPTMALLDASRAGRAAPAGATVVGARPHDAKARAPGAPVPDNAVRLGDFEIDIVERLGQESFAFGRLPGSSGDRVGALVEDDDVKPGARLALDVAIDKLHFFDAQGRRLA